MPRNTVVFASLGLVLLACGGNVVVDKPPVGAGGAASTSSANTTATTGGNGGAAVVGSTGVVVGSTGTVVGSSATGVSPAGGTGGFATTSTGTGQGGGGVCVHCSEFVANGNGVPLCAASQATFDALRSCACNPACLAQCAANLCGGVALSTNCQQCFEGMLGCGGQYQACTADQ